MQGVSVHSRDVIMANIDFQTSVKVVGFIIAQIYEEDMIWKSGYSFVSLGSNLCLIKTKCVKPVCFIHYFVHVDAKFGF